MTKMCCYLETKTADGKSGADFKPPYLVTYPNCNYR